MLAAVELVHRAQDEEATYTFKNTLTQETAYVSLLNTRRRELHRRVAEAYAACYPEQLEDYVSLLAYHYAQAGDDAQTLEYSTRAGDRAMRLYANREAVAHYDRALGIAKQQPENGELLIHLYTRRGRACELVGDYASALGVYAEMHVFARERGDRHLELHALLLLATAYAVGGFVADPKQALWLCEEALVIARELDDREAQARILWNQMLVHRFRGEGLAKAVEYGEQALALARELGLDELRAVILNDLGMAYAFTGQFDRSLAATDESRPILRALDNKPMLSANLAGSGMNLMLQGRFDEALARGEQALALDESIDNQGGKATSAWLVSLMHREAGHIGRALPLLEEAIRIAEELGVFDLLWAMRWELAVTYVRLGDLERAWGITDRDLGVGGPDIVSRVDARVAIQAQIRVRQGQIAQARQLIAPLGSIDPAFFVARRGSVTAGATILMAQLETALASGAAEEVVTYAEQAVAYARQLGTGLLALDPQHILGRARLALGQAEAAAAVLRAAREQALAATARLRLWPILRTLGCAEAALGDQAAADRARAEADECIRYLADQIDRPDLRQKFLDLTASPYFSGA